VRTSASVADLGQGLPGVAGDGVGGGVCHPDSFSPAVQQKIHHTLRMKATGISPEPNARQAIEAPLDDLLELVDRSAVRGGLDPACELVAFEVRGEREPLREKAGCRCLSSAGIAADDPDLGALGRLAGWFWL
jgi:hypothetical protein